MKSVFDSSQHGAALRGNGSGSSCGLSEAGAGDTASQHSARSAAHSKPNPLFGYRIAKVASVTPGTVILRVAHRAFMDFLHPELSLYNWTEKDQNSRFPPDIRLESSTKKNKDAFFSHFSLKRFDVGEVLLKAGEMPSCLLLMAKGRLDVLSETKPFQRAENVFAIAMELGSRSATLVQRGEAYGKVFCTQGSNGQETYPCIGEECDLLGITSPYTYIATEPTLVYAVPVEAFYRSLLAQNPDGVASMKQNASDKIKRFALLARQKAHCDDQVDTGFTDVKAAREKDGKDLAKVRKQFPAGDQNISRVIKSIVSLKA